MTRPALSAAGKYEVDRFLVSLMSDEEKDKIILLQRHDVIIAKLEKKSVMFELWLLRVAWWGGCSAIIGFAWWINLGGV